MKHKEYIVPIGEEAKDYDEMFVAVIRKQTELIRCKDCIHLYHEVAEDLTPYGFYNERHILLCQKNFDEEMGELREVMIDDFCSWAERKE